MNNLINSVQGFNPFVGPTVPSFSSPFSSPFVGSQACQIGYPMMTNSLNSFASPFGLPFNSFGSPFGFSPFASQPFQNTVPFGWNQPSWTASGWNQFGWTPGAFNPFASSFGAPLSSPVSAPFTPFGSQFTAPWGVYGQPISPSFGTPFSGIPQADWSILGGRLGSFPIASTSGQNIWNTIPSLSPRVQGYFPGTVAPTFGFDGFGGSWPISSTWNWNTAMPFGQHFAQPFGGLPTWNIPNQFPTYGAFTSPVSPTIASPINAPITTPITNPFTGSIGNGIPASTTSFGNGISTHGISGFQPTPSVAPIQGVYAPNTGTLNQGAGATFFAPTGINGLPVQLVAGQFPGQFPVQGWNPGVQTNNFGGFPLNSVQGQLFSNAYGQPVYQPGFQFTGFHGPLNHGHGEARNGTGTTINVSQRDAA